MLVLSFYSLSARIILAASLASASMRSASDRSASAVGPEWSLFWKLRSLTFFSISVTLMNNERRMRAISLFVTRVDNPGLVVLGTQVRGPILVGGIAPRSLTRLGNIVTLTRAAKADRSKLRAAASHGRTGRLRL